jgi:hydroxypyruvate isomerase
MRLTPWTAAGFRAVECLFPYEFPADEIKKRLREYVLTNVLFNLPPAGKTTNGLTWLLGAK